MINKKNNYGMDLYQEFIYLSRYSRWIDSENRRECWPETVERYFDFFETHLAKSHNYSLKALRTELEESILGLEVMPSMRALMTAGPALARDHIAAYNPVVGSTKLLTKAHGLIEIKAVVATEQTVLNKNGEWTYAKINSYGEQEIYEVTVKLNSNTVKQVRCSANHRWVLSNGVVKSTIDLVAGDRMDFVSAPKADSNNIDYKLGIIHGLVFGDGTAVYSQERVAGYHIRLCSDSKDLLPYFDGFPVTYPPSYGGEPVVMLYDAFVKTHELKSLPSENETDSYLLGFMRGYFAADGSVGKNSQVTLCVNEDNIEWLKTNSEKIGFVVQNIHQSSDETNYGKRKKKQFVLSFSRSSFTEEDFIIQRKRDNFRTLQSHFSVSSVEPLNYSEEVFCAEVPDTNTFVLETGLVTGNCSYIPIDKPTSFDEILFILMNGTGVGFSVERQFVSKLPEVADEFYPTDTTIIVSDSKLGWAKALKELVHLLYGGQIPKWDTSKLRPAGARLKTFGGRSSGPAPLEDLFRFAIRLFKNAAGRKLTSVECHDLVCKIAQIVVVGGVRRCLPELTYIPTTNGLRRIKDLTLDDYIVTNGEAYKVIAKEATGKRQSLKITHRFGSIVTSKDHRVATVTSSGVVFKPAMEITNGEYLLYDTIGYDGIDTKLPELNSSDIHFNETSVSIPTLDTDISWLIGLIHGDGCIQEKTIEISSHVNEIHLLEKAKDILSRFGVNSSIGSDSKDGNGVRLRANSKRLANWFSDNIKQSNISLAVPDCIISGSREIRSSYLAGLFDADGRTRNDGVCDQVTTIYKDFSYQISSILHSLGISSIVAHGSANKRRSVGINAKDFYTIKIVGKTNKKNWCEKIGIFSLSGKTNRITYSSGPDFKKINEHFVVPVTAVESLDDEEEMYDIEVDTVHQFTADGLIVHNSALISLSNLSDDRMRNAKSGQWWEINPQRSIANNSAAYSETPEIGIFMEEWLSLYRSKSGERGIFNRVAANRQAEKNGRREGDKEFGVNPCGEIILRPYEFCNLSEIVIRISDTLDSLKRKVRTATILGTFQSTLTDFKYINKRWKTNCDEERLLGVSLTGIMDNAVMNGSEGEEKLKDWLTQLKEVAIETNKEFAAYLGIPVSAAITTVKPSGCTALDTKIKTNMGVKSMAEIFANGNQNIFEMTPGSWITDVPEGLMVYDENNDLQKVTKLFVNGMSVVYDIETADGKKYRFTGNHKLKTTSGWKRVDELTDLDEIVNF